MIRTSIILLLLAFLIGSLLYFRVPSSSVLRARQFVGVQDCRGCHGTPASGDQYGIWQRTGHAHAYQALQSDSALQYAREHHAPQPSQDSNCLQCHSTAHASRMPQRASSFRVEDGITCEECHGPSSDYSTYAAMRDSKVFVKLGGQRGNDRECLMCHAASLSSPHCPFQHDPFVPSAGMRQIAHPLLRKSAAQ